MNKVKSILAVLVVISMIIPVMAFSVNSQKGQTISEQNKIGGVEVAPGVFYLGQAMDKGQVVEGYAFVHYAKDSNEIKKSKPVWDDTVDIYKFMFGGIKWESTMQYEVNPSSSGLDSAQVQTTLKSSLETWDSETSFELFDDELGITNEGFFSGVEDGERINRVTWGKLPWVNAIAVNYFWFYTATKEMIESDVVFSTDYTWSLDNECSGDKMDLQSIATHEFGHNGLNDLYMPPSVKLTMHGISYGYCEIHKRDLGTGDVSGIKALYG